MSRYERRKPREDEKMYLNKNSGLKSLAVEGRSKHTTAQLGELEIAAIYGRSELAAPLIPRHDSFLEDCYKLIGWAVRSSNTKTEARKTL